MSEPDSFDRLLSDRARSSLSEYASAVDVDAAVGDLHERLVGSSAGLPLPRQPRPRRVLLVAAVAALLLGVGAVAIIVHRDSGENRIFLSEQTATSTAAPDDSSRATAAPAVVAAGASVLISPAGPIQRHCADIVTLAGSAGDGQILHDSWIPAAGGDITNATFPACTGVTGAEPLRVLIPADVPAGQYRACLGDDPAGCASISVIGPTPIATAPPATGPAAAPLQPGALDAIRTFDVAEPCPARRSLSIDDDRSMLDEAARLEPMVGQVLAYGSKHLDVFGSYGLHWHTGDDASVFISFAGDLAEHRAALIPLVEFPDELIVCQVAIPANVSHALEARLVDELQGLFLGFGTSVTGALEVTLRADQEALAAELKQRYGEALSVRVGRLAYPLSDAERSCLDPPVRRHLDGLTIGLAAPTGPLVAGDHSTITLSARLTNAGDKRIQFHSGTPSAVVLDRGGQVVSASGASWDIGVNVDLQPGQSTELATTVSTMSCDPALGYELPAGDYQLVVIVEHPDGALTSPPLPISISTVGAAG